MRDPAQAAVVQLLQAAVDTVYPAAVLCSGRHTVELEVAVGAASPQTWFDLASLTKALSTSVLAMQLHDAGKLTLEDEVLPGVRVWHLLSHCSGLPACFPPLFAQHQGLLDAPSVHTRQAVLRAAQAATRTPVATQAVYSDLGFILLGDFLEQRGQARLDQQLEQWLQPLGLALSFLPLTGEKPQPVDCAQTRRESPARELLTGVVHDDTARAMLGVAGHAGLFGTARAVFDLAQLLLACYHGDRAAQHALRVSAATVQRFFAPVLVPGLRTTWGLGWDHPDPHPPAGSDAGSTSSAGRLWSRAGVGHLGFTGCSVWLDPALRAVAVLVSNRVCVATSAEAEQTKAGMRRLRPQLHDALMRSWQQPR